MPQRYQVIIVGGGPVGVALAVELAQRDVSCVVVERHHDVGTIPKGQNLTQRSLEHFYFWGCVEELRAARLLPPGWPIGGVTAYGNLMSDYWYAPPGLEQIRSFYFQENERLPQYLTEKVLRERLTQLPAATMMLDWTAKKVEQDEHGVRLHVTAEEWPYEDDVIEGDYLVGCDGARSLVREQAGIVREGPNYDQKMLLTVFTAPELHRALERFPARTTYRVLNPEYHGIWQFFGRVNAEDSFFYHGPVPRETAATDTEFLKQVIQEAAGLSFDIDFGHIGFWEMRIEVATTYQAGRVFIGGDACHSHPPYGGFGLNTGLEDVTNLGWKLAAVLKGWGGEKLLESYTSERQPIFLETGLKVIAGWIEKDDEFLQRFNPDLDAAAFEAAWAERTQGDSAGPGYEPNYAGSPVVHGVAGATTGTQGRHTFAAQPGHHLSPLSLSSGANVYEALGPDFTLLALDADDRSVEAIEQAADELKVPLKVIRDTFDAERKEFDAHLVLVRPDQFVAWVGDEAPENARDLLARAVGRA